MLTPVAEAAYAGRELFELGRASLRRYAAFAAELADLTGMTTGFRQTGTLEVGSDAVLQIEEDAREPAQRIEESAHGRNFESGTSPEPCSPTFLSPSGVSRNTAPV